MDREQQLKELAGAIGDDGSLYGLGWYLSWHSGDTAATLDGEFTADQLEAIVMWMREHTEPRGR
jgi:hypothetical protein